MLIAIASLLALAADLVGQASVIDGDTLEIQASASALGHRRAEKHAALSW
ncbi:hypothetical protein GWG65_11170 [Bradyrhizobium sp. CSA207]|nr:hypothetical protein [Bradyrhizobium sp. CSA207]MDE5442003.1 hypothetical protein [Bradyrhizobium sp. CSA207]